MPAISRLPAERIVDTAVLLSLWAACARKPEEDAGDRLRQMKLAFLAAHKLHQQRLRGLGLAFYRWTWGPMSNEVYEVWDLARASGLVVEEEHFTVTSRGESLARDFYEEVLRVEENVRFRETIDEIASDWRDQPETRPLLRHVYDLAVVPEGEQLPRPIRDIPRGRDLFEPVDPGDALGGLHVPDAWLETLVLTMRPGADSDIILAEDDVRAGRVQLA
jgi:hypothetical protein